MTEQIPRIDNNPELQAQILPLCRLKLEEIWTDPLGKHKIGCLDIVNSDHMSILTSCVNSKNCLKLQYAQLNPSVIHFVPNEL